MKTRTAGLRRSVEPDLTPVSLEAGTGAGAAVLERIAHLTDTLRGFYVESYDGPGSESARVLEMRQELGELLAPGEGAYRQERAFFAAMGWRFPA